MTALRKYQRLESSGLWRPTPAAQRREVLVSLREASLVISDPRSEVPLSHWSLPAIERMAGTGVPALFSPDGGASETLEIEDRDMIAALDTVHEVLERRRPHPGRLRGWGVAATFMVLAAAVMFWLPGAMSRHAATVLPDTTRSEIGHQALIDLTRLTGSPCASPLGKKAAQALARALAPSGVKEIVVVREAVPGGMALPGGIVVIRRDLVEKANDAETAAGFALAEATRARMSDPAIPLLDYAGPVATARLLATGALPQDALDGFAETLLAQAPPPLSDTALAPAFKAQGLSLHAYAAALEDSTLEKADPFGGTSPQAILADRDWISLQGICTD